jgi:hypothetical protein
MLFLQCSLSTLVAHLVAYDRNAFVQLKAGINYDENHDLLLRKSVYPYDYMNSEDRFTEEQLPPVEAFDSLLNGENCKRTDYAHADTVWKAFKCKTMLDYHNLYLKCDVLQLAHIFENVRTLTHQRYGLDPAHYVRAPSLSWYATQRTTKCKLDFLTDKEMFKTLQKNLRGGVSMISKRYAKANNKYMDALCDPAETDKYIMYCDANNLHGWAMSQPLPIPIPWMSEEEFGAIGWLTQEADQPTG